MYDIWESDSCLWRVMAAGVFTSPGLVLQTIRRGVVFQSWELSSPIVCEGKAVLVQA